MDVTITAEDVGSLLHAAREESSWYTQSSPLGLPLVPPQHLVAMNNRARVGHAPELDGVKPQPIWAEHAIVLFQPVFLDTPYRASGRIVERRDHSHAGAQSSLDQRSRRIGRASRGWFVWQAKLTPERPEHLEDASTLTGRRGRRRELRVHADRAVPGQVPGSTDIAVKRLARHP